MFLRNGDGGQLIEPLAMSICATLCSGSPVFYKVELDRVRVTTKEGREKPPVVHFAGASWTMYPIMHTFYDYSQRYPTLHRLEPAPNYFRNKAEQLERELAVAKQDAVRAIAVKGLYRKWALGEAGLLSLAFLALLAHALLA